MELNNNFDKIVNREGTNCSKWDRRKEIFGEDVTPLWVADMDFKAPTKVLEAIKKRVDHGVLGYTYMDDEDYKPFVDFMKRKYSININPSEILNTTGVVASIALSVLANTNEGDAIIIQTPVYPKFKETIEENNRKVVLNPLMNKGGVYCIDFIDLKKKIIENNVKMLIMSNPHNPVGRVWMLEELELLVDICKENNVLIFSDEIHGDIVFSGNNFNSMLYFREIYDNIIVAYAPSKTYNLASLYFAMTISPKKEIRDNIASWINRLSMPGVNALNHVGAMAAYEHGDQWLDDMLKYVHNNMTYIMNFCKENMPEIKVVRPQGTYLVWVDFTRLFKTSKELDDFLINKAKVGLNSGISFGEEGEGFARLNAACHIDTIKEALDRILKAYNSLQ